jgi:hypothetical protein
MRLRQISNAVHTSNVMRRLGDKPLTGAEKQKRHREKVKARLAEATALKAYALARDLTSGELAGLRAFYVSLLLELGASAEEAEMLTATLADAQVEIAALLRARGQAALAGLRGRKRKRGGGSLLARLAAAEAAGKR